MKDFSNENVLKSSYLVEYGWSLANL